MKKIILYQIGRALTVIISYYLYINYFNERELPEKRGYGWLVGIENEYERSRIPSKFYSLIPDKEGEKLV